MFEDMRDYRAIIFKTNEKFNIHDFVFGISGLESDADINPLEYSDKRIRRHYYTIDKRFSTLADRDCPDGTTPCRLDQLHYRYPLYSMQFQTNERHDGLLNIGIITVPFSKMAAYLFPIFHKLTPGENIRYNVLDLPSLLLACKPETGPLSNFRIIEIDYSLTGDTELCSLSFGGRDVVRSKAYGKFMKVNLEGSTTIPTRCRMAFEKVDRIDDGASDFVKIPLNVDSMGNVAFRMNRGVSNLSGLTHPITLLCKAGLVRWEEACPVRGTAKKKMEGSDD